MHGNGIPDAVLAEKCDCVTFFEPIALDKSGAKIRGGFFDFKPIQALFSDGISIACELIWWKSCYG
jgi:hypothetical protein